MGRAKRTDVVWFHLYRTEWSDSWNQGVEGGCQGLGGGGNGEFLMKVHKVLVEQDR